MSLSEPIITLDHSNKHRVYIYSRNASDGMESISRFKNA